MTDQRGIIALTFDTDHMSESRMEEFLGAFQWPGRAVMFCTHRYDCLSPAAHELAPHPFLPEGGDWNTELAAAREAFPAAFGWRSHSCVYSQMLGVRAARDGYLYVSTNEAYGLDGLQPMMESWGVIQMPIYYMDNCDFSRPLFWAGGGHRAFDRVLIERALQKEGLFVFDFHPVHLMLNTPDVDFYMARRQAFLDGAPLRDLAYPGRGTATFFRELCAALTAAGRASQALGDIARPLAPANCGERSLPNHKPAKPRAN